MSEALGSRRSAPAAWAEIVRTCGCRDRSALDPISRWLLVSRACVQPMTLVAVAIGGLLAVRHPAFDPLWFALAAIGSVLAHAANNMINDYFDLDAGLDTETYPRALYAPHPVLTGLVTRTSLRRAILVVNLVDAAIMITLTIARGWPVVAFALAGLFISVFYVAPPLRLKARGLGEPGVGIVWGPLMVGGTYFAATGTIWHGAFYNSIPYALLVVSVLMGKHIDKAPWDGPLGFRTLPVILGDRRARTVTLALIASFYLSVAVLVLTSHLPLWALVSFGALPAAAKVRSVFARPKPEEPPPGYPVWPLWFVSWAFLHSRRAGALMIVGLALSAVWPRYL